MSRTIRWGIIGLGKIAHKFASDLATVENAALVAVASTSQARAEEFAKEYGVADAYGNYEEIFLTKDLDVVYIATPHTLHKECTILCLQNGVGVLCEKPFAMNESEAQEMFDLAKEKNLFLMEALWTRFLPTTEKTLELLRNDAIGDVKNITADFGFIPEFVPDRRVFNPNLGGGAFLDIGIYPAFLSLLILGYPSDILADATMGSTGVDETTGFIYKYDEMAMANLSCTFGANTRTEAYIYGTKGYIHIKGMFHMSTQITLVLNEDKENPQVFDFPRETHGYDFEAREVNDCIEKGLLESPKWSLKQSKKLIHLLDKTRQKAGIVYETDRYF